MTREQLKMQLDNGQITLREYLWQKSILIIKEKSIHQSAKPNV